MVNLLNFCDKTISVEEELKNFKDTNEKFKEITKKIDNVPFCDDEIIATCDITFSTAVRTDKKGKVSFCIDRLFLNHYKGDDEEMLDNCLIEDDIKFKTKKEALEFLYSELGFDKWLADNKLFFDGRYTRKVSNKKRIIEIDGKIQEIE